ncbi:hypothetical protein WICPIJ_009418 [Wickerhamomyces pijperi]|uniref:Uncharacterized protein n=1 Tax=Wickerhamomyces pijperi TaxID=599730 RepID=A0A9P8TD08_WICPI|nr:hypothetical protein WICPIJ_009418 [Wickerhamomyces pijperi]
MSYAIPQLDDLDDLKRRNEGLDVVTKDMRGQSQTSFFDFMDLGFVQRVEHVIGVFVQIGSVRFHEENRGTLQHVDRQFGNGADTHCENLGDVDRVCWFLVRGIGVEELTDSSVRGEQKTVELLVVGLDGFQGQWARGGDLVHDTLHCSDSENDASFVIDCVRSVWVLKFLSHLFESFVLQLLEIHRVMSRFVVYLTILVELQIT